MELVNIKINEVEVMVPKGITILEAAKMNGIIIPTLCYMKDYNEKGACRICVVEIKGKKSLVASCTTIVSENMEIYTNTKRVINSRKMTIELLLSDHNQDCLSCKKSGKCTLQRLAYQYNVDSKKYQGFKNSYEIDNSTHSIVRDNNKCILCNKCVAVCEKMQGLGVIGKNDRGFDSHIGCNFDRKLEDTSCVNCGQCVAECPTGALTEKCELNQVKEALNNKNLHVVVAVAPAVRTALGEEFNYPIGTNVTGKMVTSLKRLGFDKVFDINFAADLTIMEEGNEFIKRLTTKKEALPLLTSCSPGWVRFIEYYYPELIGNLSSSKSPQQMFGSIIKTYYAKKIKKDPKDIFVVTIMPCLAKKMEKELHTEKGYKEIDAVLTTRELADFIKNAGIDFNKLGNEVFDSPFGKGASGIFGSSGGVMESALRTVKEVLDNSELEEVEFKEVRGMNNVKEACYRINDIDINVAVVSGLKNARPILDDIKNGTSKYHFIEVMTCPGGCINGSGQPYVSEEIKRNIDVKSKRAKVLYEEDRNNKLRKAHMNPDIIKLYYDFLGKPGSKKAEELLHTKYQKRQIK